MGYGAGPEMQTVQRKRMSNRTPEQEAREKIDRMLERAGWAVQDKTTINLGKHTGVAVREYQTDAGFADYVLFVDKIPCGVIEAKKETEGHKITTHEDQAEDYAKAKLKWVKDNKPLPFVYQSTGIITMFTNTKDPKPRSRPLFSFHRPDTLREMLTAGKSLRGRFHDIPGLPGKGLRKCQVTAIKRLEASFKENRPRALIQMATGSGKTYTAITFIYRLLKFAHAKRVLFLVDTKNLGEQAEQEFMAYTPGDDNRKFTELYNVQRLKSNYVTNDSQVCISTIQRMYSILRAEELDESAEIQNPNEMRLTIKPKEVEYNEKIPPEFFDFIVIDECHRSIYNIWKQVLDYFDAFLIGLTATPDKRTFGFFNENVVSEYSHENAVADGVNVGFDVYTIETVITKTGSVLKAKEYVDKRDRLTRKTRWTQLDEPVTYSGGQLDRDVVNPSQIRNVIKAFKNGLWDMFPGRQEIPKTLIFAKTDSHADDIIHIVREEFGEENAFCKKVTYNAKDPKAVLASFRNDYNPRVAVTVDMIATGTDVRPLECLIFMRDVRSRNYFEQMKGRGTRTQGLDDLQKVTPSVISEKTHFVIVDAVGVTKSIKTDSRPLERKRSVSMKDLLYSITMGADDDDTLSSAANRLARLDRQITNDEREKFTKLAGGKSIKRVVNELLDAINPDKIEETAVDMFHLPSGAEPTEAQWTGARKVLADRATGVFNGELNTYIDNVRRSHEQIIDTVNPDRVIFSGWDRQAKENARTKIADFKAFIEENRDEITALKIFYNRPYHGRELTYKMVTDLLAVIKENKPNLAPFYVWEAYQRVEKVSGGSPKTELTALVSLVRRVTGIDEVLTSYDGTVNKNFQEWVMKRHRGNAPKFDEEQMEWLRMIRDHIAGSFHVERDDLELLPFNGKGGLGKMYQLFGDDMDPIFDELNEALSA